MIGRGILAAVTALTLGLSMATHAHSPPYAADDVTTVDDTCAPSPMDSGDYEARMAWRGLWDGDDYRNPFTLGPVQEGITTWFSTASQRVFKSGRAHVTILLDDALGWHRERTFRLVGMSLASLPSALLQRVPSVHLEFTNALGVPEARAWANPAIGEGPLRYRITVPSGFFVDGDTARPTPGFGFEGVLVHELAHVLDQYAANLAFARGECSASSGRPCDWSEQEAWTTAMAESPCAVSRYATTNASEDFAESVVAWFGYYAGRQGRLDASARSALRERLGKRFGVLNKLMHGRFDWELTQQGDLVNAALDGATSTNKKGTRG